jgi:hypothetical protein
MNAVIGEFDSWGAARELAPAPQGPHIKTVCFPDFPYNVDMTV